MRRNEIIGFFNNENVGIFHSTYSQIIEFGENLYSTLMSFLQIFFSSILRFDVNFGRVSMKIKSFLSNNNGEKKISCGIRTMKPIYRNMQASLQYLNESSQIMFGSKN